MKKQFFAYVLIISLIFTFHSICAVHATAAETTIVTTTRSIKTNGAANSAVAPVAADASAALSATDAADAADSTVASTAAHAAELALASQLKELGLFLGVGENSDGTTKFDLDRAPTRTEALVMLIRVLGKESVATAHPKTHPFTDVQEWADGYVSYAYANGLTNGISDTLFGSCDPVSAGMYMTFLLRALGYADGEGKDFYWDSPWVLANRTLLFPPQAANTVFSRGDVVNVTCSALFANLKGAETTLYQRLASESVFTEAQFQQAFPVDPFINYRIIDEQIAKYINERIGPVMPGDRNTHPKNTHPIEAHIILEITESEDGLITAPVYTGSGAVTLGINNDIEGFSWQTEIWLFELDASTMQIRSCRTASEMSNEGLDLEDYLPADVINAQQSLFKGLQRLGELDALQLIDSGEIRYEPPTYEESLALITDADNLHVIQTIETEPCTILLVETGGTPQYSIYIFLIYKPGAARGEGGIVPAPLPGTNGFGATNREPDELYLDENSLTLNYSYHFNEALTIDGHTYHEAGTYRYTTDLITGETTVTIEP